MSAKRFRSQRVARIAVQTTSFSRMANKWKQKENLLTQKVKVKDNEQ